MALYTIADLHLSIGKKYPMDVFGSRWQQYTEKIRKNWLAVVKEEDTVVIGGDISWAMRLEDAREDFAFLHSLPGKKLLGKGNHDFWWDTAAKFRKFTEENGFSDLSLLYNNAVVCEDFILTGTRGWFLEEENQVTVGNVDFSKMINRETQRLKLGLDAAKKLGAGNDKEILVFLHFPPIWRDFRCREILDALRDAGVRRVFYGHIHGNYTCPAVTEENGISFRLVSSDYLNFAPYRIFPASI